MFEEIRKTVSFIEDRTTKRFGRMMENNNDITERRRTEDALRLQDAVVRNMAEGVCLTRASDAIIIYANPTFEKMFGYNSGGLNGKHVSVVNYPRSDKSPEQVARE